MSEQPGAKQKPRDNVKREYSFEARPFLMGSRSDEGGIILVMGEYDLHTVDQAIKIRDERYPACDIFIKVPVSE